ncbi:hypothetical protein [Acidaminobacterium chupaoyuni]
MAKKWMINCASCDAKKLQEESYSSYLEIENAMLLQSIDPRDRADFQLHCFNAASPKE